MGYLGYKPADKPLTAADITDSIITSAKITDATIVNADINSSAAIALTKLASTGTITLDNIQFPATQVASANANNLDDYEEGTFTPTASGTTSAGVGTYGQQLGRYTKIGRMVTVQVTLYWSAHTGTGFIKLTNLPFTTANITDNYASVSFFLQSVSLTAGNYVQGVTLQNSTSIDVYQYPTGGTTTSQVAMDTDAQFIYSVTYQV
jgi:hypothetical protein